MSSVAAEVLNDVLPALQATLDLSSTLRRKSPQEIAALKATLESWEELGKQQIEEHRKRFAQLELLAGDDEADAASGGSRPPRTNRGV
jgi:hypothetical protein